MPDSWKKLQEDIVTCERCPRLRAWGAQVAGEKRASFREWDYWGRPVENFGPQAARLLIVGLAPAAHGANRTGRMFTGDRSGDFLYASMHRCGFASQAESVRAGDGLELVDAVITAAAHCAPPANKPTTGELAACQPFLLRTVRLMPNLRGILCLGGLALNETLRLGPALGWAVPKPKPKFGHGVFIEPGRGAPFIACTYHPSQQNTFTGRLTPDMLDAVFQGVHRRLDG